MLYTQGGKTALIRLKLFFSPWYLFSPLFSGPQNGQKTQIPRLKLTRNSCSWSQRLGIIYWLRNFKVCLDMSFLHLLTELYYIFEVIWRAIKIISAETLRSAINACMNRMWQFESIDNKVDSGNHKIAANAAICTIDHTHNWKAKKSSLIKRKEWLHEQELG